MFLSTNRIQINIINTKWLVTKRFNIISLKFIRDILKRTIIIMSTTNLYLNIFYTKALINRLIETIKSSIPFNISNTFRIIQFNIKKQKPVYNSLINDKEIQKTTVLTI
jgi:hypothetical protein